MTFWYNHAIAIGIIVYFVRLFLIVEMLVLKTGRGITFESVKTRKPETPTYWSDWEFMIGLFLIFAGLYDLHNLNKNILICEQKQVKKASEYAWSELYASKQSLKLNVSKGRRCFLCTPPEKSCGISISAFKVLI